MRGVARRLQMPSNTHRIARAKFHLPQIFAKRIDHAIDAGFYNRDTISMVERQFAEDKSKRAAYKIENGRFCD